MSDDSVRRPRTRTPQADPDDLPGSPVTGERAVLSALHSVVVPVTDLDPAVGFWSRLVGAEPLFRSGDYAAFRLGEVEIGLSTAPWLDHPLVFWSVDDLDGAHRMLSELGARTMVQVADGSLAERGTAPAVDGVDPETGAVEVPGARLTVVRSPDGTLLALNQDGPGAW